MAFSVVPSEMHPIGIYAGLTLGFDAYLSLSHQVNPKAQVGERRLDYIMLSADSTCKAVPSYTTALAGCTDHLSVALTLSLD